MNKAIFLISCFFFIFVLSNNRPKRFTSRAGESRPSFQTLLLELLNYPPPTR